MLPRPLLLLAFFAAALVGGCPPENFDHALPVTANLIDRIRNDADLTGPEKRAQLAELYPFLTPGMLDALLADETTANQGGGDLRTAFDKIAIPDFSLLTADEIQLYATAASDVDDALNLSLQDSEADLTRRFIDTFDLRTPEAMEAYLDSGLAVWSTIPEGVIPGLFVEFDPNDVIPSLP